MLHAHGFESEWEENRSVSDSDLLLKQTICDQMLYAQAEKSLTHSSEYASGVSRLLTLYLVAPPSPRHEGNVGQASSWWRLFQCCGGLFAHGAAEEFGQRGIEGGACLLFDLLECLIDGDGCSFRLFGGQVVKQLGDPGNTSEQGRTVFS